MLLKKELVTLFQTRSWSILKLFLSTYFPEAKQASWRYPPLVVCLQGYFRLFCVTTNSWQCCAIANRLLVSCPISSWWNPPNAPLHHLTETPHSARSCHLRQPCITCCFLCFPGWCGWKFVKKDSSYSWRNHLNQRCQNDLGNFSQPCIFMEKVWTSVTVVKSNPVFVRGMIKTQWIHTSYTALNNRIEMVPFKVFVPQVPQPSSSFPKPPKSQNLSFPALLPSKPEGC